MRIVTRAGTPSKSFDRRPGIRRLASALLQCLWFAMPVQLALGADSRSSADTDTSAAATGKNFEPRPIGEMYVVGTQDQFESLRNVIGRDRVGPINTHWLRLERFETESLLAASRSSRLDARCWIDLSVAGRASLYFADRASERFLVRELPLLNGLSELEKETLAQIVEMSIEALIDDATSGLSRANVQTLLLARSHQKLADSPQAASPMPVVTTTPGVRWQRIVGAYYQLESLSPQFPWVHAPGAEIGIARKSRPYKLGLALRVGYQLPEVYRAELAGLRLSALRLRSILAFDVALDTSAQDEGQPAPYFGLLLSIGAQLLTAQPVVGTVTGPTTVAPTTSLFVPTFGVGCRATQPMGSLAMSLGFLADVDLETVTYEVDRGGTRLVVAQSHSVRPSIVLEFGWL